MLRPRRERGHATGDAPAITRLLREPRNAPPTGGDSPLHGVARPAIPPPDDASTGGSARSPRSARLPKSPFVRAFVRGVDAFTRVLGRFVSWFVLAMVLIGAYNALVRYLGRFTGANLSSNLYLELQWYLFSLIFLLAAGYALKENAHVRVDVVYGRLRRRARSWIDTVGAVLMLLPFCVFMLWVSWPSVHNSWSIKEVSPDPGGLPRYPLKAVILVCFVLLLAQALAQLAKDVGVLRRRRARRTSNDGLEGGGGDAR